MVCVESTMRDIVGIVITVLLTLKSIPGAF